MYRLGRVLLGLPTNNVSMNQTKHSAGNLIIVSNRGPNDFVWQDDHWVVRPASDGLVSMIDPLARQPDVTWFCCVSEAPPASESRAALFTTAADQTGPEHHIVPVPLPSKIYQAYYGTISNEVLWMLQHHLVGQFGYSSLDASGIAPGLMVIWRRISGSHGPSANQGSSRALS
jgi:trehalose-6-phosphate synthase